MSNSKHDEEGPKALIQMPDQPPNKFPQFVAQIVRRLKTHCPSMGNVKIAQTLARAGLHLGATTVGRMLKGSGEVAASLLLPSGKGTGGEGVSATPSSAEEPTAADRIVTAKRPNHVWHVDLTVMAMGVGFWCSWLPFALPQKWPFCYWLGRHRSASINGTTLPLRAVGAENGNALLKFQRTLAAIRRTHERALTLPTYSCPCHRYHWGSSYTRLGCMNSLAHDIPQWARTATYCGRLQSV